MTSKKQYSAEEKFLIIKEAEKEGVVSTCKKYGVDPKSYYAWKERYERYGIEGLLPQKRGPKRDISRLKKIEKENAALKKLLAEKELVIEYQSELIKKKYRLGRNK